METTHHGISSSVPQNLSSAVRVASVGSHSNQAAHADLSHSLNQMNFGFQGMPSFHPHSLPDFQNGVTSGLPYKSSNPVSAMGTKINSRPAEGTDNRHLHKVGSGSFNSHYFDNSEGCKCDRTIFFFLMQLFFLNCKCEFCLGVLFALVSSDLGVK